MQHRAEAAGRLLDRQHLGRHLLGKHLGGFARSRCRDLHRPLEEIGRRRPESGRGHLRIRVPPAFHHLAVRSIAGRFLAFLPSGKRLIVAAVGHPDRIQHEALHQRRERLAGHIHHRQLLDRDPAAGIVPHRARHRLDPDRRRVGGLDPVKNLRHRRDRITGRVARKPVHREPGKMSDDPPEGDLLLGRQFVVGKFPALEVLVHRRVERQLALFHQMEQRRRRDRLADRGRLEQGRRRHRVAGPRFLETIPPRPDDPATVHQGDRNPRHLVVCHPFGQRVGERRCALDDDAGPEPRRDTGNRLVGAGDGGSGRRCTASRENAGQENEGGGAHAMTSVMKRWGSS